MTLDYRAGLAAAILAAAVWLRLWPRADHDPGDEDRS